MKKSQREAPERSRPKWAHEAGLPPGTLRIDPDAPRPVLHFFGYGPEVFEEGTVSTPADIVKLRGRWPVLWVNVIGLGDAEVVQAMGDTFGLHKLAIEDIGNTNQRAKVEPYGEYLFVVLRLLRWVVDGTELANEQLSVVLGDDFVLTFQEYSDDPFDPVRKRLRAKWPALRKAKADYLAYVLMDAVVDAYFPLLEVFTERLEDLEEQIDLHPTPQTLREVRQARRTSTVLRRAIRPARDAMSTLQIDRLRLISDDTRVFLRDLYDHIERVLDVLESQREEVSSLLDTYMSVVSLRMNEVMGVLTVMGSIFLPLSFLTGLYGMNFDSSSPYNMPELRSPYGYPILLMVMSVTAAALLGYFHHRGWLVQRALDDE